jgi:thiamine-monophosphate kinase
MGTRQHWPRGMPFQAHNLPVQVRAWSTDSARRSVHGRGSLIVVAVRIAEKALIAQIRRMAKAKGNPAIKTAIGDDCAVLRLGPSQSNKRSKETDTLVTTDFSLEGIHFRRDWHAAESVGHRCLARGLSDIAAMGGDPVAAFLSLALPRDVPQVWVSGFVRGLIDLAERNSVTLAGGDTSESPGGILADIVVVGSVPRGKAVLRSGAMPGDRIYVSGELGGSAAALELMRKETRKKRMRQLNPKDYPRHFFPEPRIEVGRILRQKGLASAMIDTSDGLSTDLAHICEESGVGAEVDAQLIPRARVGKLAQQVGPQLALHGGEDYELLFTVPSNKRIPSRIAGIPITLIGSVTRSRKMFLINQSGRRDELRPLGWEHFRGD